MIWLILAVLCLPVWLATGGIFNGAALAGVIFAVIGLVQAVRHAPLIEDAPSGRLDDMDRRDQ